MMTTGVSTGDDILMILLTTAVVIGIFAYSIVLIVQAIKGFKDNFSMSLLKLFGGLAIIIFYIYVGIGIIKSTDDESNVAE
jgi:hypothetical protein